MNLKTSKMDLQKKADQIMEKKGNSRGEVFLSYASYLKENNGKEFPAEIEKIIEDLGYSFQFNHKALDWVPEAYSELIMTILQEKFGWQKKDFFKLGQEAPKYSFIIKILMRHFSSPSNVLKEASNSWLKYFDFGNLTVGDYDEEKKYVYLELRDYDMGPLMCVYLSGYILRMASLAIKGQNIRIKETKCTYRNDPYHEYLIEWD
jgi:hypothetical protein